MRIPHNQEGGHTWLIMDRIKPEELYILSGGKGQGRGLFYS